jgi:hypothetical protein
VSSVLETSPDHFERLGTELLGLREEGRFFFGEVALHCIAKVADLQDEVG